MKKSESPARAYVPSIVEPIVMEEEEKFFPRYVELPALRERGFGRRNLVWGVLMLMLGLAMLVAAVLLTGQKAVLSLAACLGTFAMLFVLARMHIFRQRNGGFLGISLVVLLGAVVALADRGYQMLSANLTPPPVSAPVPPVETEPPLLMQAFALSKPDAAQPQVKVLKDSRVVIAEKPFLIKAGDTFPLLEAKAGEATFAVRDLHVSLPVAVVEILTAKPAKEPKESKESAIAAAIAALKLEAAQAPKPEPAAKPASNPAPGAPKAAPAPATVTATPDVAAITRSAQLEAMHRYPALAIKDSPENEIFVTTYRQLKENGDIEFFSNPEWPLELAELLAKRNGWSRGDRPAPAEPAPAFDPPTDQAPPMETAPVPETSTARQPLQLPPGDDDPPQIPRAPRR